MPRLSGESMGLHELIDDLKKVPEEVAREAADIVHSSVEAIQMDWKARWAALGPHLPHLAASITSEYHEAGGTFSGETGPTLGHPQGRLGGIIEFGTRTSGPHPGGYAALDAEQPNFERKAMEIKLTALEGE